MIGLRYDIAQFLIGNRPSTLEAAISSAINAEKHVSQRCERQSDFQGINRGGAARRRVLNVEEERKKRDKRNVKCHNCGKMGHYKRECRAEGGGAYRPNDKKCSYCGKNGLIDYFCYERRADEIRKREGRGRSRSNDREKANERNLPGSSESEKSKNAEHVRRMDTLTSGAKMSESVSKTGQ